MARSGQSFLTCLIFTQIDLQVAVGDQLDVVEAKQAAVGAPDRTVARAVDVTTGVPSSPASSTPRRPSLPEARMTL